MNLVIVRDLIGVAGLALAVAGVAMVSAAAAMVVAGATMVGIAYVLARRAP